MVTMQRLFEMPAIYTFEMPKVRDWVQSLLRGRTLNLFGGKVRLVHPQRAEIVHNDIRPELNPDVMVDAFDPAAVATLGVFDTVVADPPSAYQALKSYGGVKLQEISLMRRGIERVLSPGGRVITLGWNSTGMGEGRGFNKTELLLVNSGASHNDIILLVEDHSGQWPLYPHKEG